MNEILTKQAVKDNLFAMRYPKEYRRMIFDKVRVDLYSFVNKINPIDTTLLKIRNVYKTEMDMTLSGYIKSV